MKRSKWSSGLALLLSLVMVFTVFPVLSMAAEEEPGIPVYGSYSAGNTHWQDLDPVIFGEDTGATATVNVMVDPSLQFQEYDGVGMSLDETSVSNLWKLTKEVREDTLNKVVKDWGVDLFRLVIGCCDCNERHPFWSLDDSPGDQDDFKFEHFSIAPDHEQHIVDAVKYIQALNPDVKFYASAWSAPAWMKEIRYMDGNNGFVLNPDGSYKVMVGEDGKPVRRYRGWVETNTYTLPSGATNSRTEQMNYLRDDCIDAFAEYYARYVKAYKDLGVDIYALTILNEPGADVIYPAMNMTNEQHQKLAIAIKKAFKEYGFSTQLWAHDWNINDWYSQKTDAGSTINDPTEDNHYLVFQDSAAATREQMMEAYDAVALHPYDPNGVNGPNRIPTFVTPYIEDKKIHQTETNEFGTNILVSWFNNGASSYSAWVPFTDNSGGTHYWVNTKDNNYDFAGKPQSGWRNRVGTTRWDLETNRVDFTNNFWAWGQFSKYLVAGSDRPGDVGAVRIFSTTGTQSSVSNVAFLNPNGEIVMVFSNTSSSTRTLKVTLMGKSFNQTLRGSSTTTLRWTPGLPVGDGNTAPVLADIPDIIMDQFTEKTVQLSGSDADGNAIVYYGLNLPSGITVDSKSGLVTIAANQPGTFDLTFIVSDGIARDTKTAKLVVAPKGVPAGSRVEAELYSDMSGWTVGTNFIENTANASNGQNIGWTEAGKWLTYYVDIPETGLYDVNFRASNGNAGESVNCLSLRNAAEKMLCTVSVPSTSASWTAYTTIASQVKLFAGEQYVKIYCETGGFNLDYFELLPHASEAGVPVILSSLPSIVQGFDANIPVIVGGTDLGSVAITVKNQETGDAILNTAVNGAGTHILAVKKVAAAGNYVIEAATAAGKDSVVLQCLPYNEAIWSCAAVQWEEKLAVQFNALTTLAEGRYSIKINGAVAPVAIVVPSAGLVVADVSFADVAQGSVIVVSGIQFPELFPSYSFTFTAQV